MGAGFTLMELADLPLESWSALYAAVQARRLEDAALAVSVVHAGKPKQMREHLMSAARRVAAGQKGGTVKDPARLRRMIERMNVKGVAVDVKEKTDRDNR